MIIVLLVILWVTPVFSAQTYNPFLNELAKDTWNYLSTHTTHHLPWSWWSPSQSGGSYANPTEIGLHMLTYLAAYEMRQPWSPAFSTVVSEVTATLDQLRVWQTDPENSKDGIFYHWYHVAETPPTVGESPADKALSSIDNTFLAASLMVIREWAAANNAPTLAQKASTILQDMNLMLWYDSSTHLFWHGTTDSYESDSKWNLFSNENRIINVVARARSQLSPAEFQASLNALTQEAGAYDSITVEKVAYDGSYFTYTAPALFIAEMDTPYEANTMVPATLAQIAYAENSGYTAWGLSDCFDGNGQYVGQGAPPAASTGTLETRPGLVTPHASALALITPLASQATTNLQLLAALPGTYDSNFGFRDSVMVKTGDPTYGTASNYFSALAQQYILLSIANAQTEFIWRYFYRDAGVRAAHQEMFSPVLPTPVQLYPANGSAGQPPYLLWQPMAGIVGYEIQYGQNNPPVFTPISVTGSSYLLSAPLASGTYFWRVRSVNRLNIVSEWSSTWSFTITSAAGAAPTRNYFTTSTALLTWYGVPWASGYEIQVDNSPAFTSPDYGNASLPASTTSITISPLPDGLYYWRIRAKRSDNTWGLWSPTDSFTIASVTE
ncbi:MAG: hypothetical protein K8I82_27540, partial [Anaerolineae bacterium]|nr:hypothetical protein [Anaerolineae bacterium]